MSTRSLADAAHETNTEAPSHGQTLAQKILARVSGVDAPVPGQIVEGAVDLAMGHEQAAQAVLP